MRDRRRLLIGGLLNVYVCVCICMFVYMLQVALLFLL